LAQTFLLIEMTGFLLFIMGFNLRRALRGDLVGDSPIDPGLFGAGKACMGVSWFLVPAHALGLGAALAPVPVAVDWVAVALLTAGTPLAAVALLALGERTPFGLPRGGTEIKTGGVYGLSRNPMYLGFYLVTLASLLFFPHPVNLLAGLAGILIHHRAVLAEERFLLAEHGAEYEAYARSVPRYL
jgi:protein-S-isoprenylcysteine O-methyltransferase Ste14